MTMAGNRNSLAAVLLLMAVIGALGLGALRSEVARSAPSVKVGPAVTEERKEYRPPEGSHAGRATTSASATQPPKGLYIYESYSFARPPWTEDMWIEHADYIARARVIEVSNSRWTTHHGYFREEPMQILPDGEIEGDMTPSLFYSATLEITEKWLDELGLTSPITVPIGGHSPYETFPTEFDWIATPDPYATPADPGTVFRILPDGEPCRQVMVDDELVVVLRDYGPIDYGDFFRFRFSSFLSGIFYHVRPGDALYCPCLERYPETSSYSRSVSALRERVQQLRVGG